MGAVYWYETMTMGIFLGCVLDLLLAAVFISSAGPKLLRPKSFFVAVANYEILPPAAVPAVAWFIPRFELSLGLVFLTGAYVRPIGVLMIVLLGAFATGIAMNIARGREIDCGCSTMGRHREVGLSLLVQNGVLGVVAFIASYIADTPARLEP